MVLLSHTSEDCAVKSVLFEKINQKCNNHGESNCHEEIIPNSHSLYIDSFSFTSSFMINVIHSCKVTQILSAGIIIDGKHG